MKMFEYGTWTIAFNVNNIKLPYYLFYKGIATPNPEDLERLGGPVYQIKNGKPFRAYKSKYDCVGWLENTSITYDAHSDSSAITKFAYYGSGLSKHKVHMTATFLDLDLRI